MFHDMGVFWLVVRGLAHNLRHKIGSFIDSFTIHGWGLGNRTSMYQCSLWNCPTVDVLSTFLEITRRWWTYGVGKEWMNWKEETTRCWWCCWIQSILNPYQESITKSLSCFGRHWQVFQYEENVPFGTTGCATMTNWTFVAVDNLFPTSTLHRLLPQPVLGSCFFLEIGWWTCLPWWRFTTL